MAARRAYRLGRREVAVQHTGEEIIAAGYRLFSRTGYHDVGLAEIAREAGVARGTIYYRFKSKRALFEAVIDYADTQGDAPRLFAAMQLPDPIVALRESLRAGFALYASQRDFIAKAFWLAETDPEIGAAMAAKEAQRRQAMEMLGGRLLASGTLGANVDPEDVAQTLWLLTSFQAFDVMYSGAGLDPAAIAAHFFELAGHLLTVER